MSNKERIIELLDVIPDYKMGYVQEVAADEEAEDHFCQILALYGFRSERVPGSFPVTCIVPRLL